MTILGMTESAMLADFSRRYGKGLHHARGALRHLYGTGSLTGLESTAEFRDNPTLAAEIVRDFQFSLPPVSQVLEEEGTVKFTLSLRDRLEIEAVIIPMSGHDTLCVSTQAGCARGCAFCRTARMGLARNLDAPEIIAQYMTARFSFARNIRNVVFMGMGEPFDNLEAVLTAVDILTDGHGPAILPTRITLSTCGQVAGLACFRERLESEPKKDYRLLTLAVSLHSPFDSTRDALMPVNKAWPLARLREALLALPQARVKDRLYFEYLVIPGVNDSQEDALALRGFMEGFVAKVNLIAFVAPEGNTPFPEESAFAPDGLALAPASWADVGRFWSKLRSLGVPAYSRKGKGETIQGSCGQLATEKRKSCRNEAKTNAQSSPHPSSASIIE